VPRGETPPNGSKSPAPAPATPAPRRAGPPSSSGGDGAIGAIAPPPEVLSSLSPLPAPARARAGAGAPSPLKTRGQRRAEGGAGAGGGAAAGAVGAAALKELGAVEADCAGAFFYRDAWASPEVRASVQDRGSRVTLAREPDNQEPHPPYSHSPAAPARPACRVLSGGAAQFDAHAIRIDARPVAAPAGVNLTLGFLPKNVVRWLAPLVDAGALRVRARSQRPRARPARAPARPPLLAPRAAPRLPLTRARVGQRAGAGGRRAALDPNQAAPAAAHSLWPPGQGPPSPTRALRCDSPTALGSQAERHARVRASASTALTMAGTRRSCKGPRTIGAIWPRTASRRLLSLTRYRLKGCRWLAWRGADRHISSRRPGRWWCAQTPRATRARGLCPSESFSARGRGPRSAKGRKGRARGELAARRTVYCRNCT
jgi:hypothetical protein